eukprot:1156080-Pelagomonas_calceolata.AAC.5
MTCMRQRLMLATVAIRQIMADACSSIRHTAPDCCYGDACSTIRHTAPDWWVNPSKLLPRTLKRDAVSILNLGVNSLVQANDVALEHVLE